MEVKGAEVERGGGGGSRSRGLRGHDVTIQEVWG